MRHVLGHQGPDEVEARGVSVLVLHPASLLESAFNVPVPTPNYEHFGIGVDAVFFLPLLHVSDVQIRRLYVSLVPLQKVVEGVRVVDELLFLRRWTRHAPLLLFLVSFLLKSAVLLFAQGGQIFHVFRVLDHFFPGELLQFLFPLCLRLFLLLLL